ncbi:ATP-binding protein [Novosphingobium naphthalenivorans]|uniref:ATP-binding protein n=1 Tax=Novosphingobium naphthalenivorans TaxID=273168 RepID=UPI0008335C11|nr:ATP-binding protein [Novosphingobium naphthalenivorans]
MNVPALPRRLGLPLAMQMIAILVCALLAAQLVTLALTVILPPSPAARWNMDEVAAALQTHDLPDRLERRAMSGPPDVSGQGWLVSESSREALAKRLDRNRQDVVLAFYTQLPVGGVAVPANSRSPLAAAETPSRGLGSLLIDTAEAHSIPGGPPAGGATGPGGGPGGGFPGGMPPGGSVPHAPSMPGGRMPRADLPVRGMPQSPGGSGRPGGALPGGASPGGSNPGNANPGGTAPGASSPGQNPALPSAGPVAQPGGTPGTTPGTTPGGNAVPGGLPGANPGSGTLGTAPGRTGGPLGLPGGAPGARGIPAGGIVPVLPERAAVRQVIVPHAAATEAATARSESSASSLPVRTPVTVASAAPQQAAAPRIATGEAPAPAQTAAIASGTPQPIPFRRTPDSVFEIASPPFIEGDFVAAARQPDGTWLAVAPRAEPFPNAWQKRVMLWFALSLAVVSPLAWLFARRIVLPLRDFAKAAEQLGRDPSATIIPLSGPAEIGRAANAFNQMRNRLRAFVDDRTAMVGAISHDLRTPLTRLRFRIEDVPDEQRDALLKEVTEMEAMISQVIAFIRDASTPGPRERADFADLVRGSVADAKLIGADVEIEHSAHIPVDVDPVGIRRLLGNLLENAVKYGDRARVRVSLADGEAVAEIVDAGPGIPEDEFDRAFEPFYRSESARKSGRNGNGLGLAVCRSIARAHGGDVSFAYANDGFVARVRVPAAFSMKLRQAA